MRIEPYLMFDGRTEEALEFYKKAIGAEVSRVMRFSDAPPGMPTPPAKADKIMHAVFRVGDATLMASDGDCGGKANFSGMSLTFNAKDDAEAHKVFAAFSDGGTVSMPLSKTFFASAFGMVADRFGVPWMVVGPTSSSHV